MSKMIDHVLGLYRRLGPVFGCAQAGLLLAVRLYWGIQFAQHGWGKLSHLDRTGHFFASLNLPVPAPTALFVALVEFAGGILFAVGHGTRLVSLVLFMDMTAAYLVVPDDRVNFSHILSSPSDFYNATPYTYWFASLLILIFGPGRIAMDSFFRRSVKNSD